jgi:hypothetical protein
MTLRIERPGRQGIMVFTLSGRMVAELKALFAADYKDADYKTIVLETRGEAGRSRRSDVSKRLRGGWDEAGQLSGVRPRMDGKGKN